MSTTFRRYSLAAAIVRATSKNGASASPGNCTQPDILASVQTEPDMVQRWNGAAPYWEKHRDVIRQMFAPVTSALVEDAGIGSGQEVLDIGTGPGEPAMSIAELVRPKGEVYGIDPSPEMVAVARRSAERMGAANAHFEVASADRLPFDGGRFDAAVSRFGAMFFPSPVNAVREILRVLKPGGRLALAVWHTPETNSFFSVMARVLEAYAPSPPAEPDAPDAFRFAASGKLRGVMREAGVDASERLLRFAIEAPLTAEEFYTVRSEMSEK